MWNFKTWQMIDMLQQHPYSTVVEYFYTTKQDSMKTKEGTVHTGQKQCCQEQTRAGLQKNYILNPKPWSAIKSIIRKINNCGTTCQEMFIHQNSLTEQGEGKSQKHPGQG